MAEFTQISDLFRAAADIEAETPITVGATTVGPDGRLFAPPPVDPREWSDWADKFPLKDMRRLRFSVPTAMSNTEAILEFFGVSTPERWQSAWQPASIAARQSQVFDACWEAVVAWMREAEIVAAEIPLADYDEARLRASLEELRRLTRERVEVGLDKAQQICSSAGVALVIVPELPGTRLSGCARWLNDKHALVGLTTRYKRDDQLWFTFFHEVGHIVLHRKRLSFVIDNAADYLGDDVVDADMTRYEEEADQFATVTLIPQTAFDKFLRGHRKSLTNDEIHNFAESIGVGPGIVVGRLQREGILQWHQGNALKQTVDWDFASED
jgi:HTH-type transcriptional regulator / antitoxin HigA